MKIHLTFISASLALFLAALAADTYSPGDAILLNCGASGPDSDLDGRSWIDDASGSKYAISSSGATSFSAQRQASSVPRVPYLTALVFTSPFTFSFPLAAAGRIFLRLHFYPSNYSHHAAPDAFFSVTAGVHTLLHNFSAYLAAEALDFPYVVREFSLNVSSGGVNLTFTPSAARNDSYAFVNGIEIVPIPDIFHSERGPLLIHGGNPVEFDLDPAQALETMYRLNVGGRAITPAGDAALFRYWEDDSLYIWGAAFGVTFSKDPNVSIEYSSRLPNYTAPEEVYSTARSMGLNAQINLNYNLTWILPVDSGFYYLVRLHFCEIQYPITKTNQRVFEIFLNNLTAEHYSDVIAWSGGIGVPAYREYVVIATGSGRMDLWVALHPNTRSRPEYYDAILNGLEVFKLENFRKSLAGPNPVPPPQRAVDSNGDRRTRKHEGGIPSGVVVGGIVGLGFVIMVAVFVIGNLKDEVLSAVLAGERPSSVAESAARWWREGALGRVVDHRAKGGSGDSEVDALRS